MDFNPNSIPLSESVKRMLDTRRTQILERAKSDLGKSAKAQGLVKLLHEAYQGDLRALTALKEAVGSTDFPLLFGQVNQVAMQGQYARIPQQWPSISQRMTAVNFRPQRVMDWNTTTTQLLAENGGAPRHPYALPRVPELTEYPTFELEARGQEWSLNKYGARFPFSFELFVNDELNIIQQMPNEMAQMARDTEDILTFSVLASETGPNPDFFNTTWDFGPQAPMGNIMEGNPPLSLEALEQAIYEIGRRQLNGRYVTVPSFVLVVPPSLAMTAQRIAAIGTRTIVEVDQTTGNEVRYEIPNVVSGRFSVLESPWLPLIDTSENAATTWYLVPTGGTTGTRTAIGTSFLAGREAPELRISGDQGRSVGGGDINPFEGSFSHDDVQYRVRHLVGAAGLDPSPVMVSLGTGEDEHTGS